MYECDFKSTLSEGACTLRSSRQPKFALLHIYCETTIAWFLALIVLAQPNAAMPQNQLQYLQGPQLQRPAPKNYDRPRFLTKIVVRILSDQRYLVNSVEPAKGTAVSVSPEKQVPRGWQRGALERVTYRIYLEELRSPNEVDYKIYIAQLLVERKGENDPRWRPVKDLEGDDPRPLLIEALGRGIDLVLQTQQEASLMNIEKVRDSLAFMIVGAFLVIIIVLGILPPFLRIAEPAVIQEHVKFLTSLLSGSVGIVLGFYFGKTGGRGNSGNSGGGAGTERSGDRPGTGGTGGKA